MSPSEQTRLSGSHPGHKKLSFKHSTTRQRKNTADALHLIRYTPDHWGIVGDVGNHHNTFSNTVGPTTVGPPLAPIGTHQPPVPPHSLCVGVGDCGLHASISVCIHKHISCSGWTCWGSEALRPWSPQFRLTGSRLTTTALGSYPREAESKTSLSPHGLRVKTSDQKQNKVQKVQVNTPKNGDKSESKLPQKDIQLKRSQRQISY